MRYIIQSISYSLTTYWGDSIDGHLKKKERKKYDWIEG